LNGRNTNLGSFNTVEEAAQVYAEAYIQEHGEAPTCPRPDEEEIDMEPFKVEGGTGYIGVCFKKGKNKYSATLPRSMGRYYNMPGKSKYVGIFDTAEEAAMAVAKAWSKLSRVYGVQLPLTST
jgi:hypothetical protein